MHDTNHKPAVRASHNDDVMMDLRCVSHETAVELTQIADHLTAAAREWSKPNTERVHAQLVESCRHFGASPSSRALRLQGETGPRVRVDRMEALAAIYRALPAARARAAITNAVELVGRVFRDVALLVEVRDAGRPRIAEGGQDAEIASDHPLVWRSAIVALGLMGHVPTDDDIVISLRMKHTDLVAVVLAAVLADPAIAGATVDRTLQEGGTAVAPALVLARRRIALGRLVTVVG